MIRDLMLAMTDTAGDDNALAASIALAGSLGAHLSVFESVDLPVPFPGAWGLQPDPAMATVYSELRDRGEVNAARLRNQLQGASISSEVRVIESLFGDPAGELPLHARHADLSILAASTGASDPEGGRIAAIFGALLFESGRPLLVIPPAHAISLPIQHAVIAWQPTREATRAVHDALPLLRGARSVDLVMVDPVASAIRHGELAGASLATHLARHGMKVNVVERARQRETVAATLLREAAETGAQLLVAGGYGHSRLREWAVGGTTRELLQSTSLPILFSH